MTDAKIVFIPYEADVWEDEKGIHIQHGDDRRMYPKGSLVFCDEKLTELKEGKAREHEGKTYISPDDY